MPLRLCSILGTLLLALAVLSPAPAQGQTDTDGADSASETRKKKKRKARAKKAADEAEEQADAKPDTSARQAKRSKRKSKAKEEAEEEEAEGESDTDASASSTEASADQTVPEPDAWERPPADEEKPPAAPAAKKVDPPDHGGRPISAGLLLGWGFETDRRSTAYSGNPYQLGAGLRGGYSFDFNLYLGVFFMYYLGDSVTGQSQTINDPTTTTSVNYMQYGAEAGYDWWIGPLIVRPSLQVGVGMAFTDVPNVSSPVSDFMLAPGITVVHPWDEFFLGGDLRGNIVTANGVSGLLLAATFGMRFSN